MSDPRVVVIAAVVLIALAVATWARRRERVRALRGQLDLSGLEGTVILFTDATCTRCDIVRAHLEALEVEFTEIAYDMEPETHRRVGVTGVPLLVIRDARGEEVRRFAGVVPKARLAAVLPRR